jgi:hypothetical protein
VLFEDNGRNLDQSALAISQPATGL